MFERRDGTRMTARIVTAQHDVGTCAFADALDSQPLTGAPGGGVQDRRRRKAGVVEFHHFVRNPAVFDHAAGVGTGIDGNPRFEGLQHTLATTLPETHHVVRVLRKLRRCLGCDIREGSDVDQGGDDGH